MAGEDAGMSQIVDQNVSLAQWLEAAAAKRPTPGGGSVAAVVGALAAAMGEMTVNFSLGKKDLAVFEPELSAALRSFHNARRVLLELGVEDQSAFAELTSVRKQDKGPARDAALQEATRVCIRVPTAIAATAVAILETAGSIVDKCNRWLLSDLVVCAELAMATTRCAAVNVRINLDSLADEKERIAAGDEIDELLVRALRRVQNVVPAIERQMKEEAE